MTAKERTPKQVYQAAYKAKKRAAGKLAMDAAATAWPLERNGSGWKWTTAFVADFLLRERDWVLTGEYVNSNTPMEGYCNRCGDAGSPMWNDICQGYGACNSWKCGGNQMPPEQFMEAAFTERGFELVGAYPTRSKSKFWLRHIGGEGACQQKFEIRWCHVVQKRGCAICAGKQIAVGYNDLATVKPALAAEMLFPDPTTVTAFSGTKADWRCGECNHEWTVAIAQRSNGTGCPKCNGNGGYDLTTPNGTVYFSNHATELDRPRRRIGKVGITKKFLRRRRQHANTNLNFREGSISMLTHHDPLVAKVLEDMVHGVMKNANMKVTDITLKRRETEFTPRELFRVRDVRCNGEIVGDIYDLLEWVQVQSDEDFARTLDISDEWLCTNCDGVVQYPLNSLIYTEL